MFDRLGVAGVECGSPRPGKVVQIHRGPAAVSENEERQTEPLPEFRWEGGAPRLIHEPEHPTRGANSLDLRG